MLKLALFALLTLHGLVRAGEFVPVPDDKDLTNYFGHYGHIIEFPNYWTARPRMKGPVEEIRFFPGSIRVNGKWEFYRPSDGDFRLENLERLGLTSLMIIPRDESQYATLAELRKAKTEDLGAATYQITEHFLSSESMPPGSFEVIVEKPLRYRQAYTEDERYRYIVTTGFTDPSVRDLYEHLLMSIARKTEHLSAAARREAHAPPERLPILHPVTIPIVMRLVRPIAAASLAALLLCLFGRAVAGHSLRLLLTSHATALTAVVISEAAWFALKKPHDGLSVGMAMLLWSFVVRRWGAPPSGKAWKTVSPVIGILAAFLGAIALIPFNHRSLYHPTTYFVAASLSAAAWIASWVISLIVDLIKRRAFGRTAALLLVLATCQRASAADGAPSKHLRAQALSSLLLQGIPPEKIEIEAKRRLAAIGQPVYNVQRAEVTGILTTEDTEPVLPAYFEPRIHPTHRGGDCNFVVGRMPKLYCEFLDSSADADAALAEIKGMQSNSGASAMRQLQGKTINEIVAHSWGSQVVYNAIMTGFIRPPRSLIVVGAPDDDYAKWELLARKTGTHVRMYWGKGDRVRIADKAAQLRMPNGGKVDEDDWAQYDAKRTRFSALPGTISTHTLTGVKGHSREGYYRELTAMGVIGPNINELEHAQRRRLDDAFEEIVGEEVVRIKAEAERQRRDQELFARNFRDTQSRLRERDLFERNFRANNPPAPIVSVDRGVPAIRLATALCEGDAAETDALTAHLRSWRAPMTGSEIHAGRNLSGCRSRVFTEIVRLLALPGAGANISTEALRRAAELERRLPLRDSSSSEGGSAPPPPSGGKDCFRDGDPFGCQPRR